MCCDKIPPSKYQFAPDIFTGAAGYDNVYVADASLFPTSITINPQWTIMAMSSMAAKRDSGLVDRVVIDLRYLRGGDLTPLLPLVQAVSKDKRVNKPDGLSVLIGRENESAATVLAYMFDTETKATLIGEPTPAMANNFLCPCQDIDLATTGYVFSVPMARANNGDPRPAVMPDRRVATRAADFFAGRDIALELALRH